MWNESPNWMLPVVFCFFFPLVVKVKYEKKVTQCRRTTKYVDSITAIEGLTQPYESVGFTSLIAVLSPGNYWNNSTLSF